MNFIFSRKFDKKYIMLPEEISKAFKGKLALMTQNLNHPSLRIKKMHGHGGIFEGSVTMKYRFTFEYIEDGILLRNIGNHDETLDNS